MRNAFWSWCCSFSSSLFWLLLWTRLWNRKSSTSPFWLRCHIYNSNAYLECSDHICRKGMVLQMTSWKYLHCPFSYPKATSNEIKKRILKFNLTICGESGKSPGEWKTYPFQFSGLDNSMDFKNHGTVKSLTRLSAYNVPFLSEKRKSIFLSFQWLTLIADMQRMGRSGERGRLNVVWCGEEEWGVLERKGECLTWFCWEVGG